MDYEFRILLAEKELAHLKDILASLATQVDRTSVGLETLGGHVDDLIKALRGQHPNGHGEA